MNFSQFPNISTDRHALESTAVGIGALAMLAAFWQLFFAAQLPGDLGDTRFNQVILEHGVLWMNGKVDSFWNSFFFYPAHNVIAYSDAHLGTLPIYALLRGLGLDPDLALLWWFHICCAASLASCHFTLRRLDISFLPALCGAFVFALSIPVLAQFNHVQLMPRFFIPPAFLCLLRLLELRQTRYWYALLACIIAQTYCGIYGGYLLVLCLFITALFPLLRDFRAGTLRLKALRMQLPLVIRTGLLATMLLPLAIPYIRAASAVGVRNWKEISTMLPRVASYFHAPDSLLWGSLLNSKKHLPMQHEHVLFLGLVPLLALVAMGIRAVRSRTNDTETSRDQLMLAGFILTVLLTLYWGGFSPYRLMTLAPGASSIRAVSRIVLILLFPAAYVLARAMTLGMESMRRPAARTVLGIVLAVCCVLDQRADIATYSVAASRADIDAVKTAMQLSRESVFWVHPLNPDEKYYMTHLSAMLAAQELGVSLVNGYSGNTPPGYPGDLLMLGAESCSGLETWMRANQADFKGRTLGIIGVPPCSVEIRPDTP